jgi:hypothetical protein
MMVRCGVALIRCGNVAAQQAVVGVGSSTHLPPLGRTPGLLLVDPLLLGGFGRKKRFHFGFHLRLFGHQQGCIGGVTVGKGRLLAELQHTLQLLPFRSQPQVGVLRGGQQCGTVGQIRSSRGLPKRQFVSFPEHRGQFGLR